MAYQILETNLLQSAFKAASQVTAALITAGDETAKDDPQTVMNTIADDLFAQLKAKADEDNKALREEEAKGGGSRSSGGSRGGSRGGGARRSGGGKVETDGSMEMTWGSFKGLSIADIYALDADEAANYGYESGDGAKYVKWLSGNDKNQYAADRAKAFLDAQKGGE
jgi:hypothetical protein